MAMGDRIAVMRAGKIEQIGTGAELYERPRNLFVAYFIGTPSINLFDVHLVGEEGGLWVRNAAFALRLPPVLAERLQAHVGRTLKMGIRPEDLHVPRLAPFTVTEENQMKGIVNVIAPTSTGSAVYLSTLGANPQDFIATFRTRLPAQYLGKEVPLAVNTEKAHFFNPQTEQAL